ncbi:proline iminopeptidase [Gregarina niphandrodes]|uniref:Proline iminopeptidase n=1 Tax=Gregarina niphandrodes TaxID=110365 RepID=A0A023AYA4_GRENI|nr:proline iminopeptidase [Gregarina niphandrodes]EZG43408.1 proline iminopeptidase [Gregarina niphandrodes]|eukprot:XP_011133349.1 proline iminopeptidase [Gregarina niphandrodes]
MGVDGYIDLGHGHSMYYQVTGNTTESGVPLVIVHGGPGGSSNLSWGDFFNHSVFKLVYFDQRGCGKSTPFGTTENNTLDLLIEDMEKLREHLKIEKWCLFGGSWGTTLSLSYGTRHPDRCMGFLLRGIFLARENDMKFFLWDSQMLYRESHNYLLDVIEECCGNRPSSYEQMLEYCGCCLHGKDDKAKVRLATTWSEYETVISAVSPIPEDPLTEDQKKQLVSIGILEHYYMTTQLPPKPDLLTQISGSPIKNLPCWIVHGRLDLVCPATQATELHGIWPGSKLAINDASGHWTFEKANKEKLFEFASDMEQTFGKKTSDQTT